MAVRAKAKKERQADTWAKRVERYHAILRDQSLGAGLYLGKQGINPATLAEELAEQLKATKQQVFCYKGDLVLSDPMVDWQTRGRALELAIKLWGMMPPERREVSGPDGGPIQSEAQLAISAGPGIRSIVERLESSGIAGPGPEDAE
jgi:hypothetical protein